MKHQRILELVSEMAIEDSEIAYNEIFNLMFSPLRQFANTIVKSDVEAEEIASDVLFIVWRQRKQLLHVRNIPHYLFVSTRNKSLNVLKKRTGSETISLNDIEVDLELPGPSPETVLLQGELRLELERAISTLPKQCRMVFNLVKEQDFSYKEAADTLGVSVNTVDAHLVKAMKKLTAILKSEYNIP